MGQDRKGNRTMNLVEADAVLGEIEFFLAHPWIKFFLWADSWRLADELKMVRDTIARRVGEDIEQTRIENTEVQQAWRRAT